MKKRHYHHEDGPVWSALRLLFLIGLYAALLYLAFYYLPGKAAC